MTVTLLSGDRTPVVRRIAKLAGIAHWRAELRPAGKREFIRKRQEEGARVAMIGDGLNDAPGLAQADVSIALGDAATLTRWTADIVVLGDDVRSVGDAFAHRPAHVRRRPSERGMGGGLQPRRDPARGRRARVALRGVDRDGGVLAGGGGECLKARHG